MDVFISSAWSQTRKVTCIAIQERFLQVAAELYE